MLTPERPVWLLPPGRMNPAWWLPIGLAIAGADYLTGYHVVPPVYVPFVMIAAWYSYMESSGTQVTHGICPSCTREHYPDDAALVAVPVVQA